MSKVLKYRKPNRGIAIWKGCNTFVNPELKPFSDALEKLRQEMEVLGGALIVMAQFSNSECMHVVDGRDTQSIGMVLDSIGLRTHG